LKLPKELNETSELKTDYIGESTGNVYVYSNGTSGFWPINKKEGKGFANEGGFILFLNAVGINDSFIGLCDDKLIDFRLHTLTIDFIIRNMLVPNMYAYISINFKRN